jgi:hypothetical protein
VAIVVDELIAVDHVRPHLKPPQTADIRSLCAQFATFIQVSAARAWFKDWPAINFTCSVAPSHLLLSLSLSFYLFMPSNIARPKLTLVRVLYIHITIFR